MLIVSQERSVMEEGKKNLDRWNSQWLHETIYYRGMRSGGGKEGGGVGGEERRERCVRWDGMR